MRSMGLRLLGVAARLLGATWRVRVDGEEHLALLRASGRPFIFALWHRSIIPLLWWHRNQRITLLVSEHGDGGVLADVAARWGYHAVRGSSTHGGAKGFKGILRHLRRSRNVAITPDGPRGPARTVKPGVVAAARRSGAPVLPVSAQATSAIRAGSWDGMLIPLPFARVRISYAPAIQVGVHTPEPTARAQLARCLDALTEETACPT